MVTSECDLLFVSNDHQTLKQLEEIAQDNQWSFLSLNSGDEALDKLDRLRFKVVVLELLLPGVSGLQILEWLKTLPSSPEVIIFTAQPSVETAVKALKLGAFDYLAKPLEARERIKHCVTHALEKYNRVHHLPAFQEGNNNREEFDRIIGKSPKMQTIFEHMRNVAASDSNVLIQGESGTGKELIAKAIHRNGSRRLKPFVVINCAAMPETLLESELFGYAKGAFTGATTDKQGLFEAADGGTVFLDEIGEVPVSIQVKLLRVLQEGEIRRLGETTPQSVNIRIIAASNKDLLHLIEERRFREDLYYRLNVINIMLPSLRERVEDIPLLAYEFLKLYGLRMSKNIGKISVDSLQALQSYAWPGNVRELENVIERAVVLADKDILTAKNLPPKVLSHSFYNVPVVDNDLSQLPYKDAKKRALNIFNRSYIISLLEKTGGNITAASERAGVDRSNFKKIIRKFRIETKKGL